MHNLKEKKLDYAISNFIETGKPFLGICLGMQLIMDESSEFITAKGLGLIKGNCLKFDFQKIDNYASLCLMLDGTKSIRMGKLGTKPY